MSLAGVAATTRLAARFAVAYASYAYNQPPASYLARLRPMATAGLYQVLARSALAPGLQQQRASDHMIVTSQAQAQEIRDIEPGSVITIVRIAQDVTSLSGHTQSTADYAVTVIRQNTGWIVYDIELADAGDQGGGPDQNGY